MKQVIFFALAIFSASAMAEGEEICKKVSANAGKAMAARQDGVLLEEAMSTVGNQSQFANAMIMRAYASPIRDSESARKQEISEFRNLIYAECYNVHN
ncbi:hypothetical protein [Pseudomonas sp. UBA6562]|uniref:hypothetical protein n=1 Tax=Pseudomonas sp. UBA6562 TaxID=1947332 RepID=UPI0025DD0485|nr:hypothetical protein [Pseudomonas sp. UBA6562]